MTDEKEQLLNYYQSEVAKCYEIANWLDDRNPEVNRAFNGTPSERINRHVSFIFDKENLCLL